MPEMEFFSGECRIEQGVLMMFSEAKAAGRPYRFNVLTVLLAATALSLALSMALVPPALAGEVDGGACGEDLVWSLDERGVLTISGEGEMADYDSYNAAPWYSYTQQNLSSMQPQVDKVVVENGVTYIGSYAFAYCGCDVVLPETLTTIGSDAFYHAFEHMDGYRVTLPSGVRTIGKSAFYSAGMSGVDLPNGLETIGRSAFSCCDNLTIIEVPNSVTSLLNSAFSNCSALEVAVILAPLEEVSSNLFYGCSSLETVSIPDTATKIGWSAFCGCTSLDEITIPESVRSIGDSAFKGCSQLEAICLPKSLKYVYDNAFYNCSNLKKVYVPGDSVIFYGFTSPFGFADDPITGESNVKVEGFEFYCHPGSPTISHAAYHGLDCRVLSISLSETECVYTGDRVCPSVSASIDDVFLFEESDYFVAYDDNVEVGDATATVSLEGDYSFIKDIRLGFRIGYDIESCEVSFEERKQYHDTQPDVIVSWQGRDLVMGEDYKLAYSLGEEEWECVLGSRRILQSIGEGSIAIVGMGAFAGERTEHFEVTKFDMANAGLRTPWESDGDGTSSSGRFDVRNFEYDGAEKTQPKFRVVDYHCEIPEDGYDISYVDNVNAGTAKLVITGKGGCYTGVKVVEFEIYGVDITNAGATMTLSLPDVGYYVYDGVAKEPGVIVACGEDVLVEGVDYVVSYSDNVNVGTATVTVSGIGNLSGAMSLTFEIVPSVTRLSESTYQNASGTSAVISSTAFDKSEWVVIARDDDFADAMSATGLAGALDCPIVLTDRHGLSEAARAEIDRLGATRAYVIGGRGAMPGDFEGELAGLGFSFVERIWGNQSWDTSVECARKIVEHGGSRDTSIVAMSLNFQDALSISSFAYRYEVPIYLQTQSGDRPLPDAAVEMIEEAGGDIYVPGGFGAVKASTVEGVFGEGRVIRLWGWDGYDTSNQIATYMVEHGLLSADVVAVACGAEAARGSDALSGAALAGKNGGVILLANANERMEPARLVTIEGVDSQGDPAFLSAHAGGVSRAYVLGGAYVMPEGLVERIEGVLA